MSDLSGRVHYDPIVVSAESTVVAEYSSESAEEEAYQSEAELIANLRIELEAGDAC